MTTLTIGRFSMSDGPSAIRHDGDFLELELQIDATTSLTALTFDRIGPHAMRVNATVGSAVLTSGLIYELTSSAAGKSILAAVGY